MWKILGRKSKTITGTCFKYDDIPLKTYLDVVESGDFNLIVTGGQVDREGLVKAWEKIVEDNSKATGIVSYGTYKTLLISYAKLIADYNIVKAQLVKLMYVVDDPSITELGKKGYKIDTSSTLRYTESITAALHRSDNIITRIQVKQKDLERFIKSSESGRKVTYEELMANLNSSIGFAEGGVTLARYNEYQRILKRKSQKPKQ